MEGEFVTLYTDVTEIRTDDDVQWKLAAQTSIIAQIYKESGIFNISDGPDGRFRGRLLLNNKTGDLTITNTRITDTGLYKLQIRGAKMSSKSFSVTIYAHLPVPVIIRDSSQCSSSSKCVLVCSVVNVTQVTLSWYKGNSLLSSISVSDLNSRLSLPLEVEYQENNIYSCVINNPIRNQTQHLNITEVCQTCSNSGTIPPEQPGDKCLTQGHNGGDCGDQTSNLLITRLSSYQIVLISAGVALILFAFVFCIIRKCRKTDKKVKTDQNDEKEITYADPTFYKQKQKTRVKEDDVVYADVTVRP